MPPRLKALIILTLGAIAYFFLKGFPLGWTILYPFQLLATILHEFGHAAGALLTGGEVSFVQINMDGSGVTGTMGGWRFVTIAGGYIGSAIFGNILIYAGLKHSNWSNYVLYALLGVMIAISIFWSASIGNTLFVGCFAVAIYVISRLNSEIAAWVMSFMGILSVLHIIEDFNVGPSSDLNAFAQVVPILPAFVWMFVWLALVVWITWANVRSLLRA